LADIPVTTIPRVLFDLASAGSPRLLRQAIDRAERLGRLDLIDIDGLLHRNAGRPGAKRLRQALEIYRDPVFSRARSELLFLDLIRKARLPRPALNTFIAGYEIDAYWEREMFAAEVDGWETHRTRAAFEADPLRQERLKLAGIDSIRITARRIERKPGEVAKSLGILLARRRIELGIQL
jgi:very-short-patch-repair endonuclease